MGKKRGGIGLGLVLLGAAGVGTWMKRRTAEIEHVPPDMRTPMLYVPFEVRNGPTLALARKLKFGNAAVNPAVAIDQRSVAVGHEQPPVDVFVYQPQKRTPGSGAFLYIHGGGYVSGSAEEYHAQCAKFAADLGVLVVSVQYRLAPEHPFPAGLEDCYTALLWMQSVAVELEIDAARIAVGGDSAGGGLAAALAQLAHDRAQVPVCFQLLIYPMLDDRTLQASQEPGVGRFIWTAASNRFGWASYLGRTPGTDDVPPYAIPGRRDDVHGLPSAWIGVGTLDLFRDEDIAYAERLSAAGVACELHIVPGMYHGADSLVADNSAAARQFTARMIDALRRSIC